MDSTVKQETGSQLKAVRVHRPTPMDQRSTTIGRVAQEHRGMRLSVAGLAVSAFVACAGPSDLAGDATLAVPYQRKNGDFFADPESHGDLCIAGDLYKEEGTLLTVPLPRLAPGLYNINVRLKVSQVISPYTACFHFVMYTHKPRYAEYRFDLPLGMQGIYDRMEWSVLDFEQDNTYRVFSFPLLVEDPNRPVEVSIGWYWKPGLERTTKKPVPMIETPTLEKDTLIKSDEEGLSLELEKQLADLKVFIASDRLWLEKVSDLVIVNLESAKVYYKPGEKARFIGQVFNGQKEARSAELVTEIVREMDDVRPIDTRRITLAPGKETPFEIACRLNDNLWGNEVRCILLVDGDEVHCASEFFACHNNPWAIQVTTDAVNNTRGCTPEAARARAARVKKLYGNHVEFVFWAPCDFSNFNPRGDYFSGQFRFHCDVEGTKELIKAFHEVGATCGVYAKLFNGGGKAGYEFLRQHPDWVTPGFYDIRHLDRWDEGDTLHVWPTVFPRKDIDEPFEHHARELIRSVKTFGWDAIRYDSLLTEPEAPRAYALVKELVNAALPDVRWGNNDGIHMGQRGAPGMYEILCEDESMIMEEYARNSVNQWTYDQYTDYLLGVRDDVHKRGGHLNVLTAERLMPSDRMYESLIALAIRAHGGGNRAVNRWAARHAGFVWDHRARTLASAESRIDFGGMGQWLYKWPRMTYLRARENDRSELIIQMLNAPTATAVAGETDCRVPAVRTDIPCSITLPDGVRARDVWCSSPDGEIHPQRLPFNVENGKLSITVPRVRFLTMVVVRLEGKGQWN